MKTYWFTLLDPDSDSYCDSDCKPNEYIVHSILTYFHCQTQIPNAVATWYYAELVSTDLDLDSDHFPIVFVQYRNLSPNASPAVDISYKCKQA